MFFLKLLESKKWGKLFFSNSWNLKNGEICLVLVLTCFSQTPGIQKMGKIDYFLLTCFFSTSWNPKNGKITSFGVDMFFLKLLESKKWVKLISFDVDIFFCQLLESKNVENWLVLVLTCFFLNSWTPKKWQNWLVLVLTEWNLEPLPSKYSKIMYYTYVHIYILYIYTYMFFSTPGIQKCWKLTSFGVDMFFSQLLDSKKLTKLTSFGVDGMKLRTTTLQI